MNVRCRPGGRASKRARSSRFERSTSGVQAKGTYVVPKETRVIIGQPAEYPTHITEALGRFLATKRNVRAAYLAHYCDPSRGDSPHTLIGVDAEGDWNALVGEVSLMLDGVARPGEVIDFIKMDPASDVAKYMLDETQPFYRKKRLGIF